jgi:hypothetical protein
VRAFLGIASTDSVDFIRWTLTLSKDRYSLHCNYGISKPNTNGFVGNGATIKLAGTCRVASSVYTFTNGNRTLKAVAWNKALLHFLNNNSEPLVGNAGFSYTLNATTNAGRAGTQPITASHPTFDSLVLVGRTPCGIPGTTQANSSCYKIKWSVRLYSSERDPNSGSYAIRGTAWREEGTHTGRWMRIKVGKGQTLFKMEKLFGDKSVHLLAASEHTFLFTDDEGFPLVGNADFSYTLNKLQ